MHDEAFFVAYIFDSSSEISKRFPEYAGQVAVYATNIARADHGLRFAVRLGMVVARVPSDVPGFTLPAEGETGRGWIVLGADRGIAEARLVFEDNEVYGDKADDFFAS